MSMTPEETSNLYIWEVLKKIKQEIGLVGDSEAIEYRLTHTVGAGFPSEDDEIKIIRKISKDELVKILETHEPDQQGLKGWFKLEILQPKFGEIYEKYRKACDLTSYLNNYQDKMSKGEDLPEFSHTQTTKLDNTYGPSEPPPSFIKWRELILDFNQQTICYKNGVAHEFSFEIKPLKLLLYLFDHPRVVTYIELAKYLELNCCQKNAENKDVKREVQDIRKTLIGILKDKVKMDRKDLAEIIISKDNVGYKIGKE